LTLRVPLSEEAVHLMFIRQKILQIKIWLKTTIKIIIEILSTIHITIMKIASMICTRKVRKTRQKKKEFYNLKTYIVGSYFKEN